MPKPKIKIDYNKCINPTKCRLCLGICSPGVFNLIFLDKNYHNPQMWRIEPVLPHLCTDCHKCVEECPEKAISIK